MPFEFIILKWLYPAENVSMALKDIDTQRLIFPSIAAKLRIVVKIGRIGREQIEKTGQVNQQANTYGPITCHTDRLSLSNLKDLP